MKIFKKTKAKFVKARKVSSKSLKKIWKMTPKIILIVALLKVYLLSKNNPSNISHLANLRAEIKSSDERIIKIKKEHKILENDSLIESQIHKNKVGEKLVKFLLPSLQARKDFLQMFDDTQDENLLYQSDQSDQSEQSDQREEIAFRELRKNIIEKSLKSQKKKK